MRESFQNSHFSLYVERNQEGSVYVLERLPLAFYSMQEMARAFTEVSEFLDRAGRFGHSLLIDTRRAPPRNDPEFETNFAPIRKTLLSGFRRVAVLIQTTAGKLQVERHLREDGVRHGRVFLDRNEALRFCAELA